MVVGLELVKRLEVGLVLENLGLLSEFWMFCDGYYCWFCIFLISFLVWGYASASFKSGNSSCKILAPTSTYFLSYFFSWPVEGSGNSLGYSSIGYHPSTSVDGIFLNMWEYIILFFNFFSDYKIRILFFFMVFYRLWLLLL